MAVNKAGVIEALDFLKSLFGDGTCVSGHLFLFGTRLKILTIRPRDHNYQPESTVSTVA